MENNSLNEIEQRILEELNEFSKLYFSADNKDRSGKFVTKSILKRVGDIGKDLKFDVCASGFKDIFYGEWLYDMVWYKEEKVTEYLLEVVLVLECEQAYGIPDIKYDFEKLLLANAKMRIMICLAGKTPVDEIKNYFIKAVEAYKGLNKGSRILALIWHDWMGDENEHFIPHLVIKN